MAKRLELDKLDRLWLVDLANGPTPLKKSSPIVLPDVVFLSKKAKFSLASPIFFVLIFRSSPREGGRSRNEGIG